MFLVCYRVMHLLQLQIVENTTTLKIRGCDNNKHLSRYFYTLDVWIHLTWINSVLIIILKWVPSSSRTPEHGIVTYSNRTLQRCHTLNSVESGLKMRQIYSSMGDGVLYCLRLDFQITIKYLQELFGVRYGRFCAFHLCNICWAPGIDSKDIDLREK